jgi:hypothetical protein
VIFPYSWSVTSPHLRRILFTGRLPISALLRNPTMGWHVTISISLQSKLWILEGFCCYRLVGLFADTDLHNVIKRGTVLKDVHKRFIMYQLFKATKYIHSGNVIHRDQKVSNANFYMQPFLLFQSVLLLFLFSVVDVWMFCLPVVIILSS